MKYDEYFEGQPIYLINHHANEGRRLEETSVKKWGRQYVYFANGQKALRGQQDIAPPQKGYSSPGRIFLSAEERAHWLMDEKAWTQFCRDIQYARRPQHVSLEVIQKVRDILKLPYKE